MKMKLKSPLENPREVKSSTTFVQWMESRVGWMVGMGFGIT
jgi:hypothetical protein